GTMNGRSHGERLYDPGSALTTLDRSSSIPVVASYCATFLKPEMLHIYRQIKSLRRGWPVAVAQKLETEERFRVQDLRVLKKPAWHFLRRIWFKQIVDQPWQISRGEVGEIERALTESDAQLLHIYFGHVAVLLRPLIRHWPKRTIVSFHGADVLVDMQKPAYRRATEEMLSLVRRGWGLVVDFWWARVGAWLCAGEDRNSPDWNSAR